MCSHFPAPCASCHTDMCNVTYQSGIVQTWVMLLACLASCRHAYCDWPVWHHASMGNVSGQSGIMQTWAMLLASLTAAVWP